MEEKLITKILFDKYVDTGKVPAFILYHIADKIINKEVLSTYENAIFVGMTSDINQIIKSFNEIKNGK